MSSLRLNEKSKEIGIFAGDRDLGKAKNAMVWQWIAFVFEPKGQSQPLSLKRGDMLGQPSMSGNKTVNPISLSAMVRNGTSRQICLKMKMFFHRQ